MADININKVVEETGIDFSDPKIIETKFAPEFADRLQDVYPSTLAPSTIYNIMNAYKSLTSTTTVAGAIGLVVSAVGGALNYLNAQVDEQITDNTKKWLAAKQKTVETYLTPGTWSRAVYANGPSFGSLDLYDQAYGWSESEFLAQYNPGLIWESDRKNKSDIILPTWETPPFTNGYGFMDAAKGIQWPKWAPLSGFDKDHKWLVGQPPVAPIPTDYTANYFGTLPALSIKDIDTVGGFDGSKLMPQALKSLIAKLEEFKWKKGFAPPPDYYYLFSVGTYPYVSWSGFGNERGSAGAGSLVLDAGLAAMAAAIHSPTPFHAAISEMDVILCYQQWLRCTRIRQLPLIEDKQSDDRIYLDENYLPWSANPYNTIQCISPGEDHYDYNPTDSSGELWVEKCKKHPELKNEIGQRCWPDGFMGSTYFMPWQAARHIEQSFRSFFAIRRAAIYQMDRMKDNFKEAAEKSPDLLLRKAAKGEKIEYTPYSYYDPLQALNGKKDPYLNRPAKKPKVNVPLPGSGGLKGKGGASSTSSGAPLLLITAGGAAAYFYFKNKKSRK